MKLSYDRVKCPSIDPVRRRIVGCSGQGVPAGGDDVALSGWLTSTQGDEVTRCYGADEVGVVAGWMRRTQKPLWT